MGIPNVFTANRNSFIGFGLSFTVVSGEYGRVLDIGISLPFVFVGIFCKKLPNNHWV